MKGEVTFTTWELKGWQFTVGTYNISNWEIVDNTQFDSQSTTGEHGYLALRYPSLFCSLDKEVIVSILKEIKSASFQKSQFA